MRYSLPLLLLLVLLLSACSVIQAIDPAGSPATALAVATEVPPSTKSPSSIEVPSSTDAPDPAITPSQPAPTATDIAPVDNPSTGQDLMRTDGQGAVEVDVTPSNLSNPGDTLDFEVGLNTHSVNLDMDLAKLATLKTDTGLKVRAASWNGESGGHHVSGTLAFPAQVDGKTVLEGAKVLTLIIQNVDAPERTFTWDLKP